MMIRRPNNLLSRLMTKIALRKKKAAADYTSVAATHLLLGAFGSNIQFRVEGPDGNPVLKDINKLNDEDVILVNAQKDDGTIVPMPEEEAIEQGLEIVDNGLIAQQRVEHSDQVQVYKGLPVSQFRINGITSLQDILKTTDSSEKETKIAKFFKTYGDDTSFTLDNYIEKFKDGSIVDIVTVEQLAAVHKNKYRNFTKKYWVSKEDYENNKDNYVLVGTPQTAPDEFGNAIVMTDTDGREIPRTTADGGIIPSKRTIDKRGTTNFKAIQKQAEKFKGKDIEYIIHYFAGSHDSDGRRRVNWLGKLQETQVQKPVAPKVTLPKLKETKDIKTVFNQFKNFTESLKTKKEDEIYESEKNAIKSYEGVNFTLSEIKTIAEDESENSNFTNNILATKNPTTEIDTFELKTWAKSEFAISMNSIKNTATLDIIEQKKAFNKKYFEDYGLELIGGNIYVNMSSPALIKTEAIKKYRLQQTKDKKEAIKKVRTEVDQLATKQYLEPLIELNDEGIPFTSKDIRDEVDVQYAMEFLVNYHEYDDIYFYINGSETKLKNIELKAIKPRDIYNTIENYHRVHLNLKVNTKEDLKILNTEIRKQHQLELNAFKKEAVETLISLGEKKGTKSFKAKLDKEIEDFIGKKDKERKSKLSEFKKDAILKLDDRDRLEYNRSLIYFNPRLALNTLDRDKKNKLVEDIKANRVKLSEVYGEDDFDSYKKFLGEAKKINDKVVEEEIPYFLRGNKQASDSSIGSIFKSLGATFNKVNLMIENLPTYGVDGPVTGVKKTNLEKLIQKKKEIERENTKKQIGGYVQQDTSNLDKINKQINSLRSEIKNLTTKRIDFLVDSITFPRTNTGSESTVSPWGSVGFQNSADLHKAKQVIEEKKDTKALHDFAKLVAKLVNVGLYNILKQAKMYNAYVMKGGIRTEIDYDEFFDNIIEVKSNANSAIKKSLETNITQALDNFSLSSGSKTIYPLKEIGKDSAIYGDLKSSLTKVLKGEMTKGEFIDSVELAIEKMKPIIEEKESNFDISGISSSDLIKGVCSSSVVNERDVLERTTPITIKNTVSIFSKSKSSDEEIDMSSYGSYEAYEEHRMNSENSRRDVKKCINSLSADSDLALDLLSLFGDDSYISSKSISATASELSEITSVVYVKNIDGTEEFTSYDEIGNIDYEELNAQALEIYTKVLKPYYESEGLEDFKKYLGLFGKEEKAKLEPKKIREMKRFEEVLISKLEKYGIENPDYMKLFGNIATLGTKDVTPVISYLKVLLRDINYPLSKEEKAKMEMNVAIKKFNTQEKLAYHFIKYGLKLELFEFSQDLKSSDIQEIYYTEFKNYVDGVLSELNSKVGDEKQNYIKELLSKTTKVDNFDNLFNFLKTNLCLATSKNGKKLSTWNLTKQQVGVLSQSKDILDVFIEMAEDNGFYDKTKKLTAGDFNESLLENIGVNYFSSIYEKNFTGANRVLDNYLEGVVREISRTKAQRTVVSSLNTALGTSYTVKDVFMENKINIPVDISPIILSTSLKMYASMLLLDLANGRKEVLSHIFNQTESWWKLFSFSGKPSTGKLAILVNLYRTKLKGLGKILDAQEMLEKHIESTFNAPATKFSTYSEEPEETKDEKKASINNIITKEIAKFFDKYGKIPNKNLGITDETNKVDFIYESMNKLTTDGLDNIIKKSIEIQEIVGSDKLGSLIAKDNGKEIITDKGYKTVEKLRKIDNALPLKILYELQEASSDQTSENLTEEIELYLSELKDMRNTLISILNKQVKLDTPFEGFTKFKSFDTISIEEIFNVPDLETARATINDLIDQDRWDDLDEYLSDAMVALTNEGYDASNMKRGVLKDIRDNAYKNALNYVYGQKNQVLAIVGKRLLGEINRVKNKTVKGIIQILLNSFINKA
jgi:phosphotransferase system HPr-like phosphotransfer protein